MEVLSREELNKQAHLLAERVRDMLHDTGGQGHRPGGSGDGGVSQAEKKLEEECSQIRTETQLIRQEYSQLPPVPTFEDEGSPQWLRLQLKKLESELKVWQKEQPNVMTKDPAVIKEDTRHKLSENLEQLKTTLSVVKQELSSAEKKLESECQLLEQLRQIERTLTEKIATLQQEKDRQHDTTTSGDVEMKMIIAEQSCATLEEKLKSFIEKHLPQPSDSVGRKRGRHKQATLDSVWSTANQSNEQLPSLMQVLQDLMSKCLDTPQESYLPVGLIWPPHLQLLLRCGVLQRHPDDPTLVRMTPFHH